MRGGIWEKNFQNILKSSSFVEFFSKSIFRSLQPWLAVSALQSARLSVQSFSERGSARFSFHFHARAYVQGTPDARLQRPRHVFRRILPCWAFLVERADSAAWPHRNRGTCGASRDPAKSLSPPQHSYFPKALNGAAVGINPGEGGERNGVEYLFSEQFFY